MNVDDDQISFRGATGGPANVTVLVNKVPMPTLSGGEFVANNIPLKPGANAIEILTATLHGEQSYVLNVNSTGKKPFTTTISGDSGLYGPQPTVIIQNLNGLPWKRVEIDTGVNSVTNIEPVYGATSVVAKVIGANNRDTLVVTVFDAASNVLFRARHYVLAEFPSDADAACREVYNGLRDDLLAPSIDRILSAFTDSALPKFEPAFRAMGTRVTTLAPALGAITSRNTSGDSLEFTVRRGTKVFPIYFIRDRTDRLWRIAEM